MSNISLRVQNTIIPESKFKPEINKTKNTESLNEIKAPTNNNQLTKEQFREIASKTGGNKDSLEPLLKSINPSKDLEKLKNFSLDLIPKDSNNKNINMFKLLLNQANPQPKPTMLTPSPVLPLPPQIKSSTLVPQSSKASISSEILLQAKTNLRQISQHQVLNLEKSDKTVTESSRSIVLRDKASIFSPERLNSKSTLEIVAHGSSDGSNIGGLSPKQLAQRLKREGITQLGVLDLKSCHSESFKSSLEVELKAIGLKVGEVRAYTSEIAISRETGKVLQGSKLEQTKNHDGALGLNQRRISQIARTTNLSESIIRSIEKNILLDVTPLQGISITETHNVRKAIEYIESSLEDPRHLEPDTTIAGMGAKISHSSTIQLQKAPTAKLISKPTIEPVHQVKTPRASGTFAKETIIPLRLRQLELRAIVKSQLPPMQEPIRVPILNRMVERICDELELPRDLPISDPAKLEAFASRIFTELNATITPPKSRPPEGFNETVKYLLEKMSPNSMSININEYRTPIKNLKALLMRASDSFIELKRDIELINGSSKNLERKILEIREKLDDRSEEKLPWIDHTLLRTIDAEDYRIIEDRSAGQGLICHQFTFGVEHKDPPRDPRELREWAGDKIVAVCFSNNGVSHTAFLADGMWSQSLRNNLDEVHSGTIFKTYDGALEKMYPIVLIDSPTCPITPDAWIRAIREC
ncbi:MAG: hypothetical protein U0354_01375 [Candidatus Sericytochromatia bacterium]